MGSNSFGNFFKVTTWGESHGKAIGVVIDGCPAGIEISIEEINEALAMRSPGRNKFTSPRKELDQAEILSGLFEGLSTGAPISLIIYNQDADSSKYEPIKNVLRPGHANFVYQEKYGIFDYKGGGRASARETAARVAAGAIAKGMLTKLGIKSFAHLKQVGNISSKAEVSFENIEQCEKERSHSPLFCINSEAAHKMSLLINEVKLQNDSIGGIVEFVALGVEPGLGDPIYEKLEAKLAFAMMSIPASKGFEVGSGFAAATMRGSLHNDLFIEENGKVKTASNDAGGILGGISNGMPIVGSVAFKPTSSIMKDQKTIDDSMNKVVFKLPEGSRHDPCVAIRAVPVVEAMLSLVLVDTILANRLCRW